MDIQDIVNANPRLDSNRAAAYLGISPATLATWRCRGGGPQFLKLGRSVRYLKADLDRFMDEGRRDFTAAV